MFNDFEICVRRDDPTDGTHESVRLIIQIPEPKGGDWFRAAVRMAQSIVRGMRAVDDISEFTIDSVALSSNAVRRAAPLGQFPSAADAGSQHRLAEREKKATTQ